MKKDVTFAALMRREFRNFISNKIFAAFIILAPIGFALLMTAILWNGVMHSIPVAVWDADGTFQSRELTSMLDASPYLDVINTVSGRDEGLDLMNRGKVNALFIIPENFASDMLSGRGATVAGRYNNQFMTQGGTINKAFTEVVAVFAAKYDAVKYVSSGIPPYAAAGYVQPVSVRNILLYNPALNYSWFLLLGMIPVLWQFFAIGAVICMLGLDMKRRDSHIMLYARSEKWWYLTGKLLPYLGLFLVQYAVLIFIMFAVVGIPVNGSFLLVLLASVLFITATMSVGAMVIAIVKNLGLGTSIASIYVSPAFAYAGVTFPYEAMPVAAQVWADLLPITHYHKFLVDIAIRNAPMAVGYNSLLALFAFTLFCYPVALLLYRYRLQKDG